MQSSKDFPDSFYRIAIKGLCVRDEKLLMMQESEDFTGGLWELPGGGLDFGEDFRTGFEREVKEEMGLTVTHMSEKPVYLWTNKVENWREMDWYYSLILAYQVEFKNLDITPSQECVKVDFFGKEEIANLEKGNQMTNLHTIFNPGDFVSNF